eukprot:1009106-Prorocentrum_lima.AAC.1
MLGSQPTQRIELEPASMLNTLHRITVGLGPLDWRRRKGVLGRLSSRWMWGSHPSTPLSTHSRKPAFPPPTTS